MGMLRLSGEVGDVLAGAQGCVGWLLVGMGGLTCLRRPREELGLVGQSCGRKGSTVSFWGARSSRNVEGTCVGFQGVWDSYVGGEFSRTRELARNGQAS